MPPAHIKLNDTTWRKSKTVDEDLYDVEVGDSKQVDFFPQVKIQRWGNEVNFSVRRKEHPSEGKAIVTETNGKIEAKKRDIEDHFYEKPDGYEFETVLRNKPTSNVVEYSISTKGLDFFYQPALTQEEIDEGASRPENVVGSYAVYHSTKKDHIIGQTNYKTGKAFHIYRPKIIDADNNEVWGELDITDSTLTVTIPQSFLDTANYPIVVDPTFGYTTIGGSTWNGGGTATRCSPSTSAPEDGDVQSITGYVRGNGATYFTTFGMYQGLSTFLSATNEISMPETAQWNTANYAVAQAITNGTNYYICGRVSNNAVWYYDAGTNGYSNSGSYPNWQATLSNASVGRYSFYATYTASGGSTYTLTADLGTFTLTGIAASITKTWNDLVASVGSFTLTGISAGLAKGYKIVASLGTFALTGISASITKAWNITASVGAFTLTGIASILTRTRKLVASVGSFVLTGIDATFKYTGFTNVIKNSATLTNISKNSATLTNTSKNSATLTNTTKNTATLTNVNKVIIEYLWVSTTLPWQTATPWQYTTGFTNIAKN